MNNSVVSARIGGSKQARDGRGVRKAVLREALFASTALVGVALASPAAAQATRGGNGGASDGNGAQYPIAGGAGGTYGTAGGSGNSPTTGLYDGVGGGGGGVGAAGGKGGSGGRNAQFPGGDGGTAGGPGLAGGAGQSVTSSIPDAGGYSAGGGGGGGGGTALTTSGVVTVTTDLIGGAGGKGGDSVYGGGGGGGAGGYGMFLSGTANVTVNAGVTVRGGAGGNGGSTNTYSQGGQGGGGGVGVFGSGTLVNGGMIATGAAGSSGTSPFATGAAAAGFAAVVGSDLNVTNSGTITGNAGADAITYLSGTNSLTLTAGGTQGTLVGSIGISGSLAINPGTAAGGSVTLANAIHDSTGGAGRITKVGAGTLRLTGANTYTGGTFVDGGVLDLASANALSGGVYVLSGALRFSNLTGAGTTTIHLVDPTVDLATTGTNANPYSLDVAAPASADPSVFNNVSGGTVVLSGAITTGTGNNVQGNAIDPTQYVTFAGGGITQLTNTGNNWTGTTTINSGATLQGTTDTISGGSIVDNGTLAFVQAASGTLNRAVSGNGVITVAGVGVGNVVTLAGGLSNAGGLSILDTSTVAVSGSAVIAGTAVRAASGATLNVASTGVVRSTNGVTVTNLGGGFTINNAGTIDSPSSNTIQTPGVALTLNNSGTVSNGVNVAVLAGANSRITNSGTVTGGNDTSFGYGVQANGLGTQVTNQNGGVIQSAGTNPVRFDNGGTLVNELGGTIRHTGTANTTTGAGVYSNGPLSLTNNGRITTASTGASDGVTVLGLATITNTGTRVNGVLTGGLIQAAAASGIAITAAGSSVTNSGSIVGGTSGSFGYGIAYVGGTITNQAGGVIVGSLGGVSSTGTGLATINNAGTIGTGTVDANGNFQVGGAGFAIAVTNGIVRNTGTLNSTGASVYQIGTTGTLSLVNTGTIGGAGRAVDPDDTVVSQGTATIFNSGTITTPNFYAVGLNNNGGLINAAGGQITAGNAGNRSAVNITGTAGTIDNYGALTSTGNATASGAATNDAISRGIQTGNSAATINLYAGSTTGTITTGNGADALTLYSGTGTAFAGLLRDTVTGATTSGATPTGNQVVLQRAGTNAAAIVGAVNLGGGTNTLVLRGLGDGTAANGAVGTIGATITNATNLIKQDSGTWLLTGSVGSSFVDTTVGGATTPAVRILAGTLIEQNSSAPLGNGTIAISSGATLALDGGFQQNAVTFTGAGTLAKTGAGSVNFGNGGTVTVALSQGGLIDVRQGSLLASSSGQASWSGNRASLNIDAGATFDTVEGDVVSGASRSVVVDALTGAGTLQGGIDGVRTIVVGTAGGTGTFTGVARDNTNFGNRFLALTKEGTGTQTLTGTNTYTGATTVSGGTLALSGTGSIANSASVTNNANLSVAGLTNGGTTVNQLTGTGTIALGANTLTANNAAAGTISGVIAGSGGFTKAGAGTLTLTTANTYTGTTTVSGGTLALGAGGATGSVAGAIALANNSLLQINRSGTPTLANAIGGNGRVELVRSAALTGAITATGGVIVDAGVAATLTSVTGATGNAVSVVGTGATITVVTGGTVSGGNSGILTNVGTTTAISNRGLIEATGVGGNDDGITAAGAITLDNYGTLRSTGQNAGAVLFVGGNAITNYAGATITGGTGAAGYGVNFAGVGNVTQSTLSNAGTIAGGTNVAAVRSESNALITNSGTITGSSNTTTGYGILFDASATGATTNQSGGVIQGGVAGIRLTSASQIIDNSGVIRGTNASSSGVSVNNSITTISNSGFVVGATTGITSNGAVTVTNSGTIGTGTVSTGANPTFTASTSGAGITAATATLTNSGTISGGAGVSLNSTAGSSSVTNNVGGVIIATAGGSNAVFSANTLTLFNSGTLTTPTVAGNIRGAVFSSGANSSITNYASGTITGGRGVELSRGGTIDNYGQVTGTVDNALTLFGGGTITNHVGGTLTANGAGAWGMFAGQNNDGSISVSTLINDGTINAESGIVAANSNATITNTGSIIATDAGIWGFSAPAISVTNSGTIDSGGNGVRLSAGGTVSNTGSIISAGQAIQVTAGSATITNGGTIRSNGQNAVNLATGGTVSNNAGATILAANNGVQSLGALTLTNNGAITGGINTGFAIAGSGNFADSVTLGAASITDGGISLGDGNDTFVLNTGATVAGVIDGGTGTNTFTAQGTGGATTIADNVTGFGTLTKNGTGTLTLTGANSGFQTVAVNAGTLAVGGGSAIDNTAAVTVAGGATFALNAGERIGSLAGAGNVSLGTSTLTVGDATSTTFSGVASGTGSLVKTGTGTLTISGQNTYTGATDIREGTLQFGNDNVLSDATALTIYTGGALDLAGFSDTVGSFTIQAGGELRGGGVLSANSANLNGGTVGMAISAPTVNQQSNTTQLSGTVAGNVITATNLNITGGTLSLGGNDQIADGTILTINGPTNGNTSTFDLGGFFERFANTSITNAGAITGSTGYLALDNSTLNNAADATVSVNIRLLGGTVAIDNSGTLSNGISTDFGTNATLALTNRAGGSITQSGDAIYNFGTTNVLNAGTITGGQFSGVGTNGAGGNGSGTIVNAVGGTITGGTDGTFGGALQLGAAMGRTNVVDNYGTLTNGGNGTAIYTTFDGNADITLRAGSTTGAIRTGSGNDALSLYTGTGANSAAVVDAASGITLQNAGANAAAIVGAINLGGGSNTLNLRGDLTGTLAAGTLGITTLNKLDGGSWTATDVTATTVNAGTGTANSGNLTLAGTGTIGDIYVNGASLTLASTTAAGTATIHMIDPTTNFAVAGTYANNFDFAVAAGQQANDPNILNNQSGGLVTLSGTLTESVPGQYVTFTGSRGFQLTNTANNWTGVTRIDSGIELIGTTATLSGGSFVDNGILTVRQNTAGTLAQAISGTGIVVIDGGSPNTALTGAITVSGGIQVNAGTTATLANVSGANGNAVRFTGAGATLNVGAGGSVTATGGNALYSNVANNTVNNAGTLAGNATYTGVFLQANTGTDTIVNSGTIRGFNALDSFATLNLTNSGTLIGLSGAGVYADRQATVTNTGTITGLSNGQTIDAGLFIGSGTINNNAGTISGNRGVQIQNGGTLNNSAQITGVSSTGVRLVNGGTVNNLTGGTITATAASAFGIFATGAGTLDNRGTINADSGVVSTVAGFGTTNSGTITAAQNGVRGQGAAVNLTNSGTIRAGAAGVLAEAAGSTISNSGTIAATTAAGRGVVMAGGTLNNLAGGVITGGSATGGTGAAILLTGTGNVLNLAAGSTVNGLIDASATTDASNSYTFGGTLNGGFVGGAGNDLVTLTNGASVSGILDGAAGNDTLALVGAGSLNAVQIVNFENGTKSGAGTWTITGTTAASPAAWAINGGTLAVAGGNAIADTAAVTIGANGALALNANETIGSLAGAGSVTLGANTLTTGGANASPTYAGVISGSGGLTKVGTGTLTLSGANTYTGATTVNAGTLALGASNVVADASAVTVAAGAVLNLGAFSDTVASLALSGSLNGTGTLTAATYTLTSGTVNANLGAGTLTQASGTSTLNGTSAAGTVNVTGGTLALGAGDRLADTAALTVANGATLNLGANSDTVGSAQLAGTLAGTGTLTAATYMLTGGTVNANLGAGTLTQASGTSTLNGTSAAATVNVSGGTLTLGASERLSDAAALAIAAGGVLDLGAFAEQVGSATIGGGLNGTGTLTAATYTLTGGTVNANLGAGTLTQASGTSTLNGTSAAATVNVTGGTLTLGANERLSDAAALAIAAGGVLDLGAFAERVGNATIGGGLNGTGTLTAATYTLTGGTVNANLGAGTLTQASGTSTLNGTSAAATVNVTGGTLTLGASNRLADAAALTVANGATLNLGANSDTVGTAQLAGTLAGTGTLTASQYQLNGATVNANLGAGTLAQTGGVSTLTGTSAATQVQVQAGTLTLGANERLADTAVVTVNAGATLNAAGRTETIGTLVNGANGGGAVALGTAGRLVVGGTNADFGFAGTFTGSGDVEKVGTGTFAYQANANSTARLNVLGGTLLYGGTSGGAVRVAGGTLTGSGTVGTNLTLASGTLSPGTAAAPIATFQAASLNVSGGNVVLDLAGAAGSYASDLIRVSGAANLSGGTVTTRTTEANGNYQVAQFYTVLTAGSLTGTFANGQTLTAVSNDASLQYRLRYDLAPNSVIVELRKQIDFATGLPGGGTAGQRAVAGALNGSAFTASDAYAAALNQIAAGTAAQRAASLDSISGEGVTSIATGSLFAANGFADLLRRRVANGNNLNGAGAGAGGMAFHRPGALEKIRAGAGQDGAAALASDGNGSGVSAWIAGYGMNGQLDGRGGVANTDYFNAGVGVGADGRFGNLLVGLGVATNRLETQVDARSTKSEGTLYQGGGYLGFDNGATFANVTGTYFEGDVDSRRSVFVNGAIFGVANGKTETRGYTVGGAIGHRFALDQGFRVTPMASVGATSVKRDGFTETGAGVLSLTAGREKRDVYQATGELRLGHRTETSYGWFEPFVSGGARRTWGDRDAISAMRFTGAPVGAGAFTINGAELSRWTGLLGGGFDAKVSDRASIGLSAESTLSKRQNDGRINLHLKVGF